MVEGKDKVMFVWFVDITAPSGSCSVLLSLPSPCLVQLADTPIQAIPGAMHRTEQVKEAGSPSETVRFDWSNIFTSKTVHEN